MQRRSFKASGDFQNSFPLAVARFEHDLLRGCNGGEILDLARIHKKLTEAQSFLSKIIEQDGLMVGGGFDNYLSAFLSAGMSVRAGFHYKQDRARNADIKAWRENWEKALTAEEKHLYEFMHVNRNAEVHTTGAALNVEKEPVRAGVSSSYSDRSGTVEALGSPSVLLGHDTAVIIQK